MESPSSINSYLKTTQIVMGIATVLSAIVMVAITAINGGIPINTLKELQVTISLVGVGGFCLGAFISATIARIFTTTFQETRQEKKSETAVTQPVTKTALVKYTLPVVQGAAYNPETYLSAIKTAIHNKQTITWEGKPKDTHDSCWILPNLCLGPIAGQGLIIQCTQFGHGSRGLGLTSLQNEKPIRAGETRIYEINVCSKTMPQFVDARYQNIHTALESSLPVSILGEEEGNSAIDKNFKGTIRLVNSSFFLIAYLERLIGQGYRKQILAYLEHALGCTYQNDVQLGRLGHELTIDLFLPSLVTS